MYIYIYIYTYIYICIYIYIYDFIDDCNAITKLQMVKYMIFTDI